MVKYASVNNEKFVQIVLEHYREHVRSLPWRETRDPYQILVSEIMLQQTQVDRVIPKYRAFLLAFPTVKLLASASLLGVLTLWQGLGYNRRGKALWEAARMIMDEFNGEFPLNRADLMRLPGVGHYTAGAIMAFAFDLPVTFIETNIRTVYLHHFFADRTGVDDREILPLIEETLDQKDPRNWYYALMDYGAYLKKTQGSNNGRSKHHTVQSRFEGSRRQARGAVIRALSDGKDKDFQAMVSSVNADESVLRSILDDLLSEGMIVRSGSNFRIP